MTRDRAADLVTLQAVQVAAQGGEHARAATLAKAALDGGLEHPLLYNVLALWLEAEQRVADAVVLLERAVQVAPNDPAVRNALGLCLLRLERPVEALAQFDALLKLNAELPFAHTSRGAALLALGELALAEASYRRALVLDPRQGVAVAGLAHIAVRRGAHADARRWAEQAVTLVPGFPDAVLSLAAAEFGTGAVSQAEARLRAQLADARLEPLDRAQAWSLLGDVLDAQGRAGDAFGAYTECNLTLRQVYRGAYGAGRTALRFVEAMTAYFDRARPEEWRRRPLPEARPAGLRGHVFLLGFPRSGTTLLEVILEGHPAVAALEENEALIDGVQAFMQTPEDLGRLARADDAELGRLRAAYWKRVAEAGVALPGKVFVDKHPLNTLKLPLIALLFPEAKIVCARRDPRDVVLSCFRRRFRMSAPMYELLTLEGAARYYDAVMRLSDRLDGVLSLERCEVRYEQLVKDLPGEMGRVCAFLGLEWTPAMGDFAARTHDRPTATPSTAQLARGLNTAGLGSWRPYEAALATVMPILEPWVRRFGVTP